MELWVGGTDSRGDDEGWASGPGLAAAVRMRAWGQEGDRALPGTLHPGLVLSQGCMQRGLLGQENELASQEGACPPPSLAFR